MTDMIKRMYLLLFVISLFGFGFSLADEPLKQVNQMKEKTEVVASNEQEKVEVDAEAEEDDDLDDEELLKLAQAEINDILGKDEEEKQS